MPFQQRRKRDQPVEHRAFLRALQQLRDAEPRALLDRLRQPSDQLGQAVRATAGEPRHQAFDFVGEVVTQPANRGELEPVGALVQADPEPEVVRRHLHRAFGGDHVRRDQQQLPGAFRTTERVVLAEHARREEGQDQAGLDTGAPGQDRPERPALLG